MQNSLVPPPTFSAPLPNRPHPSCKTAMEFAFGSRPTTAAADDEESGRLRRFPDPPPPSQPHGHGDANTSGVDASLLARRQELLLEMHKGLMHQNMILHELMETEHSMGRTASGYNYNPMSPSQDYRRGWMPSMPSWEAPLCQPCPCGSGSSMAVRATPVYPHVKQSSHATEQTRPGNDAEQHQEGRSSGVKTHPFNSHFELCHSPSKQTPVAGKAVINQMWPLPGHQQAIVWEKIGVEVVHNTQPLHEIKNQNSEGQKAIECAIEDSIKKPMQQRLQYKPVDQENAANNEQKSTEFSEPTLEGTSARVKRKLTPPSSPVKKQMNSGQDVKEEVPGNRWTCTLCQANCTCESDYHSHLGGKRHRQEEAGRARLYCAACDVHCTSEKMLASHLRGRRHRGRQEGSDSD